jgi:hypothetical protein
VNRPAGLRGIVTPEEICVADEDVLAARRHLHAAIAQAQEQEDALAQRRHTEDALARRRHAAAVKVATAAAAATAAATAATAAAAAATAAAEEAAAAAAAAATAQEEQQELVQEQEPEQEMQAPRLEPEPMSGVMAVELSEGGQTPAPKRGERFVSSPPGDEPLPPVVRLRRFQVLECRHSSGDTTVIDRDKVRGGTHTHTSGVRPISGISL